MSDPAIPFSDPPYLMGLPSPYFTSKHLDFQQRCKAFIDENLTQYALQYENEELVAEKVFGIFAKANMLIPSLACPLPVEQLKKLGIHEFMGVKVEDYDYLYTFIYWDEMMRCGLAGVPGSLTTGVAFGVPPLYKFGSPELQARFLPDLLLGKKRTCIAITEPSAGSDVANIQTTAIKDKSGKYYIVNGYKKWISNGIWSDLSTMAVRTGGPGAAGLSLLVVPLKGQEGVTMRRIKCTGQSLAGATYIELDNVKVPVENLIGEEGKDFNHERMQIAVQTCRAARTAVASAFEYCMAREAFGKKLMDQPVVRHRLAKCGAELESLQAWVELFCFQMAKMNKADADRELGGLTAMAKAKAGMVFDECARCAVLLFGGNGYTRSGQGELVERLYREVPGARIPGGSEDVMLDLSIRELVKNFKAKTAALKPTSKL